MNDHTVSHGLVNFGLPIPRSRGSRSGSSTTRQLDPNPSTVVEPSERVTVQSAVIGLIASVTRLEREIATHNVALVKARAPISQLSEQLASFKLSVQLLHKCLESNTAGALDMSKGAALVHLDTLIALLTACVMACSELSTRLDHVIKPIEHNNREVIENNAAQPDSPIPRKDINRISSLHHPIIMLCNAMQLYVERTPHVEIC